MSERWLLYDAGCSVCAALAREVEALSGGRLQVRSLRDPEVRALLDRAHPGWRWEPMLIEIEGERVRVFTGLSLRARLVQVLGPVRALRVAQVVARFGGQCWGWIGGGGSCYSRAWPWPGWPCCGGSPEDLHPSAL